MSIENESGAEMQQSSVIDLEELRKFSSHELDLIEGLCRNALDVRDEILILLDAEDEAWDSDDGVLSLAQFYRALMKRAHWLAEPVWDEPRKLVLAVLSQCAKKVDCAERPE
jgi:hypothetical protein